MDAKQLEKTINMGKINQIVHFNEGFQNTIYKLKIDKRIYCLRIYNRRSKNHVEYEIAVLNKLKKLPVPKPIKIKGNQLLKIEKKWAIIYPYIEGNHIKNFTHHQLEEVVMSLAEMHILLKNFVWDKHRFEFYNLPDSRIKKYSARSKNSKIKYLKHLNQIIRDLKFNRLIKKLPYGAIHVDLSPGNTLFKNGKLNGILDFDNGYIGPLILDLGKSIMFFASKNKKFNLNKAKIMINAYNQVRTLSKLELRELYKAIKFAFLSHIFMDYYMRALKVTSQEYFEWIVNDLYASYKDFRLSEKQFYEFLQK